VSRSFVLSPAHCGGERARLVLNERAAFDLARRVRVSPGAPLGEVFSFLSGLYFRGKLSYARAFARPLDGRVGVYVITPTEGLRPADEPVDLERLRGFACVDIEGDDPRYREPLDRDARQLAARIGPDGEVILLGSIATGKYVDPLLAALGERLKFPLDFVGRGDMSRGGLLLRCARAGMELTYVGVRDAVRRGPRPPRLAPVAVRREAGPRRPRRASKKMSPAGARGARAKRATGLVILSLRAVEGTVSSGRWEE